MVIKQRRTYRLLGHAGVPLTFDQLAQLIRQGLLSMDTKVIRDGEGFATAVSARADFQQVLINDDMSPPAPTDR